jgi:hypothetical protein
MYITAMWLRAPATGARGVNVSIYRHPDGLPHEGDLQKIAEDPHHGPPPIRYQELKTGGNGVQAYLDLVLEDDHYNLGELRRALEHVRDSRFHGYVENPLLLDEPLEPGGQVKMAFSVNLGFQEPDSQRAIFSLLCATALQVLEQRRDELAA